MRIDTDTDIGRRRARFEAVVSTFNQLDTKSSTRTKSFTRSTGPRKIRRISTQQQNTGNSLSQRRLRPAEQPVDDQPTDSSNGIQDIIAENKSLKRELDALQDEKLQNLKELEESKSEITRLRSCLDEYNNQTMPVITIPPTQSSTTQNEYDRTHTSVSVRASQARDILLSSLANVFDDTSNDKNIGLVAIRCLEEYIQSRKSHL